MIPKKQTRVFEYPDGTQVETETRTALGAYWKATREKGPVTEDVTIATIRTFSSEDKTTVDDPEPEEVPTKVTAGAMDHIEESLTNLKDTTCNQCGEEVLKHKTEVVVRCDDHTAETDQPSMVEHAVKDIYAITKILNR